MKRYRWSSVFPLMVLASCGGPNGDDAGLDAGDAMVADASTDAPMRDAGSLDSGMLGDDAGARDAGRRDAGPRDSGPMDSGPPDGGPPDTGPPDTGPPDSGPPPLPAITSVAPTNVALGSRLTIDGTDFDALTSVTIGGVTQAIATSSSTSITLTVDAGTSLGTQPIVVTTSAGSSLPFDVTVLDALYVVSAAATDATTVVVTFSRPLAAASVDAADFVIAGLPVSGASVSGASVTLTTDPQVVAQRYTVTASDVLDTFGNGLTGNATAMFDGFVPPPPRITSLSPSQVVRGWNELTIDGTDLASASVTIGGVAQTLASNTDTQIVVLPVAATTPLGTQSVLVTTADGVSPAASIEVLDRLRIVSAIAVNATEVRVTFNRDVAAASVSAGAFTIARLTVTDAAASGPVVTLTTSAYDPGKLYRVGVDATVLDALMTPATTDTASFLGYVAPPPPEFVIVRVGDGTTLYPSTTAAPVFLERRAIPNGALLGTLPMPTSASGSNLPFTLQYNGSPEGSLSRSPDGRLLAMLGYQSAPGTATVSTTTAARIAAVIDAADFGATPSTDTSTTLGTTYTSPATSVRGAVIDGSRLWVSGGTGVFTTTLGSTSTATTVATSPASGRTIGIFENELFYTSAGGLYQVGTGIPTSTATTTQIVATASPYAFSIFDIDFDEPGYDLIYVCDEGGGQGLKRFVKSGGTWMLQATLGPAVRQVACYISGNDVACIAALGTAIYFVRDLNRSLVSNGTALGSPIGAPGTNTQFRGVALAPIP